MQKQIANEIIENIRENNSNISIALTGSVARGTYNKNSDIDFLIANKDFRNSYYIYFYYKGIKVGMFSYHKKMFWQKNQDLLYHYHNMRLSYIYHSQIIHDSDNTISQLKSNIDEILKRKILLKKLIITDFKDEIRNTLYMEYDNLIERKEKMYHVLSNIISIFFMKEYNNKVLSKKDSHDPYSVIKEKDFLLYTFLKQSYPCHEKTQEELKEVFENHILVHY